MGERLSSGDRKELKRIIQTGRVYFRDSLVGSELTDDAFLEYGRDRTQKYDADFDTLVMPGDTAEVAALVAFAYKRKIPLTPSGGRTGLAGGAVAGQGELVLSLARMNRIMEFDPYLPALTCQAGVITAAVQEAAREKGLYFPVDLAAAGSSTIGGNLATNAGGIHVIKYGMTRRWALGLKAVIGTGEILETGGGLLKNNTGLDLLDLLIGSEGTLAVITEVTLRLAPAPGETSLLLLGLGGLAEALECLKEFRLQGLDILALEYFDAICLEKVREHRGPDFAGGRPFREEYPAYLLCEYISQDTDDDTSAERLLERGLILDAARAGSSRARKDFFSLREDISESLQARRGVYKYDVSLPLVELEGFIQDIHTGLAAMTPRRTPAIFGHLGDGNLHVNILQASAESSEEFYAGQAETDEFVYSGVRNRRGSISAEHGIGLLKRNFLSYSRSDLEISLMASIKNSFDPGGILNPGKLFTPGMIHVKRPGFPPDSELSSG